MQSLYALVVTYMFITVYTQLPKLDTLCTGHADCLPQNGVCGDYRGHGRQATCQCRPGQMYDMDQLRCDENITSEDLSIPAEVLLGLPQNWRCNEASQYCWSTTSNVHFSGFIFEHVKSLANSITGWNNEPVEVSIPTYLITWRCTKQDEVALILSGTERPLNEYCISCGVWCGIHGACVDYWSCRCETGWAGARCDVPIALPLLGVLSPFEWPSCNNDDDCQGPGMICLFSDHGPHCGCGDGYAPLDSRTCVRHATVVGRDVVVARQTWRRMNLTYSVIDSRYVTYWNEGVYNILIMPRPVDYSSYNARLDVAGFHLWHCANNECPSLCANQLGGPNCDRCPSLMSGPQCANAPQACADKYCHSRGACRADGNEGCFCDIGFEGDHCQISVPVNGCAAGRYGAACELSQSECSRVRCSGNGQCLSRYQGCQCDVHFRRYANCSTRDEVVVTGLPLGWGEHFTGRPVCPSGRGGIFCELVLLSGDKDAVRLTDDGINVATLVLIQLLISVAYSACIVCVVSFKTSPVSRYQRKHTY